MFVTPGASSSVVWNVHSHRARTAWISHPKFEVDSNLSNPQLTAFISCWSHLGYLYPLFQIYKGDKVFAMRTPRRAFFQRCLLLASLLSTSRAFTLSELQQVAGFSPACTNAYNTPLTDCTYDDFFGAQGCSASCVAFLGRLTATVNRACKDTTAFPDTLIGMFFSGRAVQTLCPNSVGQPGDSGNAQTSSCISATSRSDASTSIRTAETITRTSSSGRPPSLFASSTVTSSTPSLTSASTSLITTSPTLQTTTTSPHSTVPLSLLTLGTSITPIATPEPTSSSQPAKANAQGGGGGTPFDITSSSGRIVKTMWLAWPIPVVVLLWLVWTKGRHASTLVFQRSYEYWCSGPYE